MYTRVTYVERNSSGFDGLNRVCRVTYADHMGHIVLFEHLCMKSGGGQWVYRAQKARSGEFGGGPSFCQFFCICEGVVDAKWHGMCAGVSRGYDACSWPVK